MKTSTRISAVARAIRQRLFKPAAIIALLGGIAVTAVGAGAVAHNSDIASWHHGGMTATSDPADMASHVELLLQHIYAEVDASDAQKAQLDPIVRQAATDLMPLHTQFHAGHGQVLALLGQDRIDRDALESLRAADMDVADQASRRIVQLIADVADVLTPAQRKVVAGRLAQHLGLNQG